MARLRNPQIDAWRGIAVLLVITGHLLGFRYERAFHLTAFHEMNAAGPFDVVKNILLRFAAPLPGLGVCVFFVISGYLITSLLLTEEANNAKVNIGAFYVRRAFRIIPALFVFLATVTVLRILGLLEVPFRALAGGALFLCDTSFDCANWWVGHTWTLAVEEQFYLVWPLAFSLTSRKLRPFGLVLLWMCLIAASYVPSIARLFNGPAVLGVSFPCIAAGAFYACWSPAAGFVRRFATNRTLLLAILMLLVQPFFASLPMVEALGRPFISLLVAFVFFGTLDRPSFMSRILNMEWISRVGLISYSLYLWQQLFTGRDTIVRSSWDIVLLLPIAVLSYSVIERPLIRIGHRFSHAIINSQVRLAGGILPRAG